MSTPSLSASRTRNESTSGLHGGYRCCQLCGSSLVRVQRRSIDKFVSLFHPIHRYRCSAAKCTWQGNLRAVSVIDSRIFV